MRVSGNPIAQALTVGLGAPITATSANLRGEAPPSSDSALLNSPLGGMLDFVVRGGETPGRAASTVLELDGARALMHRDGVITRPEIMAVISSLGIQFEAD